MYSVTIRMREHSEVSQSLLSTKSYKYKRLEMRLRHHGRFARVVVRRGNV